MIYLYYKFKKSKLPVPESVLVYTEEDEWVRLQVEAECKRLFPESRIRTHSGAECAEAEMLVIAYLNQSTGFKQVLGICARLRSRASRALGIYCIDERCFTLVKDFRMWAARTVLEKCLLKLAAAAGKIKGRKKSSGPPGTKYNPQKQKT